MWLGIETPASRHTGSSRLFPTRVPVPENPRHYTAQKTFTGRTFRFADRVLYLAHALTGKPVG